MPTKEIVCLAYSRKEGGSCLAGIDLATGKWIRALGNHAHGALADNDCLMRDRVGKFIMPTILDVLEIDFSGPQPGLAQPENWKISGMEFRWLRRASLAEMDVLRQSTVDHPELFRGYRHSITRDDVQLRPPRSSLALVRPSFRRRLDRHRHLPRPGARAVPALGAP